MIWFGFFYNHSTPVGVFLAEEPRQGWNDYRKCAKILSLKPRKG